VSGFPTLISNGGSSYCGTQPKRLPRRASLVAHIAEPGPHSLQSSGQATLRAEWDPPLLTETDGNLVAQPIPWLLELRLAVVLRRIPFTSAKLFSRSDGAGRGSGGKEKVTRRWMALTAPPKTPPLMWGLADLGTFHRVKVATQFLGVGAGVTSDSHMPGTNHWHQPKPRQRRPGSEPVRGWADVRFPRCGGRKETVAESEKERRRRIVSGTFEQAGWSSPTCPDHQSYFAQRAWRFVDVAARRQITVKFDCRTYKLGFTCPNLRRQR